MKHQDDLQMPIVPGWGYRIVRPDGDVAGCVYTRGVWNIIGTGAFWCYAHQAVSVRRLTCDSPFGPPPPGWETWT